MSEAIDYASTNVVHGRLGLDLRATLRSLRSAVEGIREIRLLPCDRRSAHIRHKVFVVLESHDVDRDRRLVELLCQLDADYDLVPPDAVGLIPDGTTPL